MNVKVKVTLSSFPIKKDWDQIYVAAENLTNDKSSIETYGSENNSNILFVEFTINKAKQIDVVDKIGKKFRYDMQNYNDSSISFPKQQTINKNKNNKKNQKYTLKQGQYLAFIYFYTKINGCAPAELDMQRYFKTTAPSVHRMILKLEEHGFIERIPKQAGSIKLLLPPSKLPGLQ